MKKPILILLFLLGYTANSQPGSPQAAIDSLLAELSNPASQKSPKAVLDEAIGLSLSSENYRLGQLYFLLGEEYLNAGQYDSAGLLYQQSISPLESQRDSTYLGRAYIGIGYVLYFKGNYTESLEYNLKAEKIFRSTGDKKLLGRAIKRMADVFLSLKDLEASERYYDEALSIAEKQSDTINIIRALNSVAGIYDETARSEKVDAALKRATALGEAIGCLRCLAISYSQWGISAHSRGQYKEAIQHYRKEYEMNRLQGLVFDQYFVYQNISEAYVGLKQYDEALVYSDSAMLLAKADNAPEFIHDSYKTQYKIYKAKNNPAAALQALEMKAQYLDTLFNGEKARIQEDMKVAYETDKKEQQIASLEQENTIKALEAEQSEQFRLYLMVVVVLLLLAAGVLYSRYRLKQQSAQVLDAKNQELQELNKVKDRLFAIISHDLKSPLSSFHTVTSTLNQYYTQISPEDIRKYLEKLETAARGLEEQMKNLLEWSVNQIAERKLKAEAVDVREIAENLKGFFQLNLEVKRLNLYIQMDGPLVVETDREYLQTVLRNLISNAIKFTPPEGSIWVKGKMDGNTVVLQVEDSGIGIAKEDFSKLFTLTADKKSIGTSAEKGTGLGLVLVKEMMDRLGGKVEIKSELGRGTTFYLTFMDKQLNKAA